MKPKLEMASISSVKIISFISPPSAKGITLYPQTPFARRCQRLRLASLVFDFLENLVAQPFIAIYLLKDIVVALGSESGGFQRLFDLGVRLPLDTLFLLRIFRALER